jgi:hypothetical protein
MRCRKIVEILPDTIGEVFVIHGKMKIKVWHGLLPSCWPTLAATTAGSTTILT